jgi:hypothetical protein
MIYINIVILVVVGPPESDHAEVAPEVGMVEHDGSNGSASGCLAECKKCGWSKDYPTSVRAKQALGGHSRFCPGKKWRISPFSRPP